MAAADMSTARRKTSVAFRRSSSSSGIGEEADDVEVDDSHMKEPVQASAGKVIHLRILKCPHR
jgi:hypothetical protein